MKMSGMRALTEALVIVDETLVYSELSSSAVYYNDISVTGVTFATNDHFLVEVPGGIALALCSHTDHTLRIIIVEAGSPGTLYAGPISFGAGVVMNTTGSARPASPGGVGPMPDWQVLVPDIISPTRSDNNLRLISTDRDFSSASVASTLTDSGYALQMATFDRLVNGEYVVAYKRVPTGLYYSGGSSVISDNGDIILEVYDSALTSADVTVDCLIASHSALGNRPHMVRWDRYVITCWDQAELDPTTGASSLSGVYLRIDFLTGVL